MNLQIRLKGKIEMNYSQSYDVFLSYRREGGEAMAILLRDRLAEKGYRVFLDIESLNSGSFNEQLFAVIDECTDFVLVGSKGCLDRCANDGDWVRLEIQRAFKSGKNIVPVMLRGFEFPETLPDDIDAIRLQNGVSADNSEYFDAAVDRLAEKFIKSKPTPKTVLHEPPPLPTSEAFVSTEGSVDVLKTANEAVTRKLIYAAPFALIALGTGFLIMAIVLATGWLAVFTAVCYVAAIPFLWIIGKKLQQKAAPDSANAVFVKREPYYVAQEIVGTLNTVQPRSAEIEALTRTAKTLEDKLAVESDFGIGSTVVIDTENNIAKQLQFLQKSASSASENIASMNTSLTNINTLLIRRRELKKR
jgi:hypothetical protein